jgi:hypothetical protein
MRNNLNFKNRKQLIEDAKITKNTEGVFQKWVLIFIFEENITIINRNLDDNINFKISNRGAMGSHLSKSKTV